MKKVVIILITFYTASSEVKHEGYLENYGQNSRVKRQEDERWNWGYVDIVPKSSDDMMSTESVPPIPITNAPPPSDPCEKYEPELPDFSVPGRRISEIKCAEYIWQLNRRVEKSSRSLSCSLKMLREKYPNTGFAIGGHSTFPGEFPHMGAVGWKAAVGTWIFKCGSFLISSNFVLTAAHCTRGSERDTTLADPIPKIIRLGDKNIIDVFANGVNPVDVNISRIIVYPFYQSPKKYYDIALMQLAENVVFTKFVQPACLWSKFDTSPLGTKATLTGWGVVETAGKTNSPELQAADVDIVDSETCNNLLRPACNRLWCGIEDHQLCAGKLAGGVDACQGDSGGPLQVKIPLSNSAEGSMHYAIGVTSFGIGCARTNTPGIYSRVSSFIDWIEDIVWSS